MARGLGTRASPIYISAARKPQASRFRARITTAPRRAFRAGFDRTGGFYGRFAGGRAGGELKFHDLDVDDAVVAVAGAIAEDSCNVIAQGNTESQRIGRKVVIRRVNWRYEVRLPAAANQADTPNGDSVRVILYLDKQTNGATAAITDILETADYQSFYNLANSNRFRILMDRTSSIVHHASMTDGASTGSFGAVTQQHKFNKLCSIPIEYDNSATTGVITSQRSNNLGVLTISATGVASFLSKMRLRYSDA